MDTQQLATQITIAWLEVFATITKELSIIRRAELKYKRVHFFLNYRW